jgi:hypothetical protein
MVGISRFSYRKKLLACIVLFILAAIAQPQPASAKTIYPSGRTGNDVSWPPSNCSAEPTAISSFGIVGVTGGLNFTHNPCLFKESHQFDQLSLYINTGYPGHAKADKYISAFSACPNNAIHCAAYKYGYAAAENALLYADSQNVTANTWWLDVETENSWTKNTTENSASIQGAIDAINKGSFFKPKVGIYSTPNQWKEITGGWKNQLPAWIGTGSSDRKDAIAACTDSPFTGGTTELTQYILDIDHDYSC